jgi:hypothetical protein
MVKVRLILMFQGKVEHDIKTEMLRPKLKEMITVERNHYKIKFIQHMLDEDNKFESLMVTGVRKV